MNTPLVVELEISASTLAGIFRAHNWPLDGCKETTPTASDLAELITHITLEANNAEEFSYITYGRLLAFTDAEVPGVIELALKIGYARLELGAEADEPMTDDNFGEDA
jgi:YD repeat-containing protein